MALRFDVGMCELQHDFLLSVLAPFRTEADCCLLILCNPAPKDDDIPDDLIIEPRP
jgi:hypothetical protein